jgi:hypothetical protein
MRRMGRMIGVMASDMRAWKKWRGVRRVTEEGTWRRTTGGRGRKARDNGLLFSERLTWKGVGHMEGGEWMMRRKGPPGPKREEDG